jgi:methyl-accepting chemotaxis protein
MLLSFMSAIKRRTIVRDLTVGLSVTIVLVTATVSLLYYVSSTSTIEKRLKDQAMAHLKRLSYSLTTPLLNNDDVAILRTAWEYQRFYDIAVLRVFNADGDAIYDPNYTVLDPKITEETALITATKSLHWYDLKVGSVEVSLKRKEIIEVQQITLYLTLMIMFSVILTVIAASSLLLKVFLTRPLAAIAQGIEVIADGSYDRVMAPVNRWEIDVIIEKINVMANQFAER